MASVPGWEAARMNLACAAGFRGYHQARRVHHEVGRGRGVTSQQPAVQRPAQQSQMYATFRLIVGTSSSVVSFFSFLQFRTQPGHRHGSSQQFVQPTRSWHLPKGQGLLLQPATQIGSHFTSNSTFGCFFVPGSQTQMGVRPQVAPQCMQAGFSSSLDLLESFGLSAAFSLSAAPQASRTAVRSMAVMIGLCMV